MSTSAPPPVVTPAPPASAPPLADQEARRRIRHDLDHTLVIEAAAGTGKTSELVARIVRLVSSGRARLDGVLAVTFTDKAAGEMKLRLRGELEKARDAAIGDAKDRLSAAMEKLEVAQIATLHSVCVDLLRERPVAAGIDPLFEVAAGEVEQRLYQRAFDGWFRAAVEAPPEGVRRLLRRRPRGRDGQSPREQLERAGRDLIERRDFDAPWRRPPFERAREVDQVFAQLAAVGDLFPRAQKADDWIAKSVGALHAFCEDVRRREALVGRDLDGLEAELAASSRERHWNWSGGNRKFAKDLDKGEVVAQRDLAKAALDQLLERSEVDLAALLREELRPLVQQFEERKARAGCLDFLDLLLRARDLVRDDGAVRRELQTRYSHLLVDEFQDTDPLQAELLLLLAADDPEERDWTRARPKPGKLFVVGDPKQSIYRFRRADIAIYEAVKERLLAAGAEVLHLSTSFRAVPALQQAVNAAFAPRMIAGPDRSQAAYVALDPYRQDPAGRPALVALPAPRVHSDFGKVTNFAIEASLPEAVGGFVDWLCNQSGWTVTERDEGGREVPVAPRHVCLLFKRLQSFGRDVTAPYLRALEARQIAHVLVGGRSFHQREEVLALRNALAAIEWPDDELHVFATLRGPLFALGDDALLAFRGLFGGRLFPLRRLDEAALLAAPVAVREVAAALRLLGGLHRKRNRRPIGQTLAALLDAVRAHAGVAIAPAGEQGLANLLRVLELARRFEAAGATSFRAFVERLAVDAERGEQSEATVVEEGTEGVRLMTVHKAKGLEFPVVILCDPTAPGAGKNPTRHVDPELNLWAMPLAGCCPLELTERRAELLKRDQDEAVRVAYVAATRARDLLVVPVAGEGELAGWLEPLRDSVYPNPLTERRPEPAPGCPPFGKESVTEVPAGQPPRTGTISPGLHQPRAGAHAVVWWDPSRLPRGAEAPGGVRGEQLLVEDAAGPGAEVSARHEAWAAARARAQEQGARPSQVVITATALSRQRADAELAAAVEAEVAAVVGSAVEGAPADAGPAAVSKPAAAPKPAAVPVEVVAGRDPARPSGARFGTLVHAVLAEAALAAEGDARAAQCAQLAAAHGRSLGAAPEEVAAAARAAAAALAHPLLRRAAQSADCRRETDLFHRQEDGALLEGVVDLAFSEPGEGGVHWTVVDFKTDARPELEAKYQHQLQLYAAAIAAATGRPASAVVLAV